MKIKQSKIMTVVVLIKNWAYQTLKAVFDHSSKRIKVRQKYSTARRIFNFPLMSRIQPKYCSISTSYLPWLFGIFILLHIWLKCVCFGDFLPMRTLCDAYHKEFESH